MTKPLAAALCIALTACSFGMNQVPRSYTPDAAPVCDSSAGAPVADFAGATLSGLSVLGGLAAHSFCDFSIFDSKPDSEVRSCENSSATFVVVAALATVLYTTSAVGGLSKRSECVAAHRAHATWKRNGSKPIIKDVDPSLPTGAPGTVGPTVIQHPECELWKQRLAAAKSVNEKLRLVRQRPKTCR